MLYQDPSYPNPIPNPNITTPTPRISPTPSSYILLLISSLYLLTFEKQQQSIITQIKMQTPWNPLQNFQLSLGQNMANEKNKNLVGKKISKTHKTSNLQTYYNDLQPKNTKKNQENNPKKANESKNFPESKKTQKKKQPSLHRNTQTPDLFNQRRIKTEGPSTEQDLIPSLKKEQKKVHVKSTSITNKNLNASKKQKIIKPTKSSKDKHIKSCEIYNAWKRLPDVPDHTISENLHGVTKKKRQNSNLICNDKVVSKLLNASLLASEIGASPLVTSDRKSAQFSHSRTFKECMSSIDLRIIRNIQDDVPFFLERESTFQDTVRSLMKRNQISLEQLTRKVTIIQRFWRKRQRTSVINTYKRLFQRATDNFFRQDKFVQEVSEIDFEIDKSESIDLDIFRNDNLAASLRKSQEASQKNSLEESQNEDYRVRWIQESEAANDSFEKEEEGLNFGKYRQLVKQEIKSLNKKMGVEHQEKKGGLDSKYLLEQLMKHNFNKKWIEEQSSSLSDRKIQKKQDNPSMLQSQEQDSSLNQHTIQTYPKHSKNDDDDGSYDDSQIYDRNKYVMTTVIDDEKQEISDMPKKVNEKIEETIKIKRIQIEMKPKHQNESIDLQWINNQLLHDQIIVKNYLDCGLDSFPLQVNQRQLQKIELQEEKDQYSSDEAIGQRFQRANIAILRRRDKKSEAEPKSLKNLTEREGEELISALVNTLLNEFALDISVILKKCNAALPQRPKPVPHPRSNGIQTNFNSIRIYVEKVTAFARQRDDILDRITENINKDIGPTSLQILSYLRPQPQDSQVMHMESESQDYEEEDGLFVIPAELFEEFQTHLQGEFRKEHKKEMGPRIKAYLSFWNRCIFESYNECLDYQRPFGVEGKPYDWLKQRKVYRTIKKERIPFHLEHAKQRLLEQTEMVAGIMFQNQNGPMNSELSEQQMHMMNQERLSRILGSELIESQSSWINYNDQMAELLVELSRVIEQKLFFEFSGSELKKLLRHRRVLAEQNYIQQSVEFNLDELQ